jgi:hypothetical protein
VVGTSTGRRRVAVRVSAVSGSVIRTESPSEMAGGDQVVDRVGLAWLDHDPQSWSSPRLYQPWKSEDVRISVTAEDPFAAGAVLVRCMLEQASVRNAGGVGPVMVVAVQRCR